MSDVAVAPSAPASAPSAPSVSEVPVNPSPPSIPHPIGAQAPDKPVGPDFKGSEHRPESRREGIQRAFERAKVAQGNTEPAKARIGHNQPPEETPKEKPEKKEKAEPPLNLRKRPVDQDKEVSTAPPRGDHGHFAPKETPKQASQTSQPGQPNVRQLPANAPYRDAPTRMNDRAKAEWHTTPESVRAEVHRMTHEFTQAYHNYRNDNAVMNTLRPFQQLAQKSGTTLQKALTNFVTMETQLRNDPVGGLDRIVNNLNLRYDDGSKNGRQITLVDLAWHIINQTPEQRAMVEAQKRQQQQAHELMVANQRIYQLENHTKQVQTQARFNQIRGGLDQYAQSHPRLDELGQTIVQEVNLGFPLDEAYRRATLLHPTTQAAQTRTDGTAAQTRTPPAQTRNTDRSIHGAPGSLNGAARRREPVGRRESITNAMKKVNGSL